MFFSVNAIFKRPITVVTMLSISCRLLAQIDNYRRIWTSRNLPQGLQDSIQLVSAVLQQLLPDMDPAELQQEDTNTTPSTHTGVLELIIGLVDQFIHTRVSIVALILWDGCTLWKQTLFSMLLCRGKFVQFYDSCWKFSHCAVCYAIVLLDVQ